MANVIRGQDCGYGFLGNNSQPRQPCRLLLQHPTLVRRYIARRVFSLFGTYPCLKNHPVSLDWNLVMTEQKIERENSAADWDRYILLTHAPLHAADTYATYVKTLS